MPWRTSFPDGSVLSGRLAMSFPRCTGQEPLSYSHMNTGRPGKPGQVNRFSSAYIDVEDGSLYPFGHGLSYTGAETVMCFVQDVCSSTARPVRELKGFQKIFLNPQEEAGFSIAVKEEELRFMTRDGVFETEPGVYRIYIGDSCLEIRKSISSSGREMIF